MAVITYEDVETAIGRSIRDQAEQEQVTQWIADVEMIVSARLGDLGLLDQPLLAYVIREVVIAWMRHRDETAGDADTQLQENYLLRILDPWWALLTPAADVTPRAYTVSLWGSPVVY